VSGLLVDIRQAFRGLRANPGFTAVAVVTLALGIGANATILSWIRATLLDPVPGVSGTGDLVTLQRGERSTTPIPPLSYPDYRDLRQRTACFAGLVGHHDDVVTLTGGARPERRWGALVSANYFDVLRARPALGRFFLAEEEAAEGGAPVVVLSHDLWRNRFGQDPAVLGRTLEVNRRPYTVVGVAPPGFRGAKPGLRTDLFAPLAMKRQLWSGASLEDRGYAWLNVLGRLRPGVDAARAERETDLAMRSLVAEFPDAHRGPNQISLDPLWRSPFGANVFLYTTLPVLLALAAVVLLLACANVANLQLVRFVSRRREVAIRLSMGATRGQLVRQMLVESLVVALVGGALAVLLAASGSKALADFVPPTGMPIVLDGRVDAWVLLVTLALATASGLLFGTIPALRASSLPPAEVLKEEANRSSGGPRRGRLSGALVVAQLALSVVLLVAGGLFIRSVQEARAVHPGFDADGVLLASFEASPATGHTAETALALQRAVIDRVEALPGVEAVTIADWVPLGVSAPTSEVEPDGYVPREHESRDVRRAYVGPGYARTMGIRLAAGRDFTKRPGAGGHRQSGLRRPLLAGPRAAGPPPARRRPLALGGRGDREHGLPQGRRGSPAAPLPPRAQPVAVRHDPPRAGRRGPRGRGSARRGRPPRARPGPARFPRHHPPGERRLRHDLRAPRRHVRRGLRRRRPGPRQPRHLRRHRLLDAPAHPGDRGPHRHGRVGIRRRAPRDGSRSAPDPPGPRSWACRLRRGGAPPADAPLRREPARPGHLRRRGPAAGRRGPRRLVPAGPSRDPRGAERGPPPGLKPRPDPSS